MSIVARAPAVSLLVRSLQTLNVRASCYDSEFLIMLRRIAFKVHALIHIQLSDISIFRSKMRCYAAGSLYTAFLHLFDTILFIVSLLVAIIARINSKDGTYGVHI